MTRIRAAKKQENRRLRDSGEDGWSAARELYSFSVCSVCSVDCPRQLAVAKKSRNAESAEDAEKMPDDTVSSSLRSLRSLRFNFCSR